MEFDVQSSSYEYLLTKFTEDTIKDRYQWLTNLLLKWLKQKGYENRVLIHRESLEHVIIDYFVDIDRLKEFSEINLTNQIKIYAYTAFWLLRRKPLQVIDKNQTEDLVFVNEEMVADLLLNFLYNNPPSIPIVKSKKDDIGLFEDTLLYFFKYRNFTAQGIEMFLLCFNAGRGYQYSIDYQS